MAELKNSIEKSPTSEITTDQPMNDSTVQGVTGTKKINDIHGIITMGQPTEEPMSEGSVKTLKVITSVACSLYGRVKTNKEDSEDPMDKFARDFHERSQVKMKNYLQRITSMCESHRRFLSHLPSRTDLEEERRLKNRGTYPQPENFDETIDEDLQKKITKSVKSMWLRNQRNLFEDLDRMANDCYRTLDLPFSEYAIDHFYKLSPIDKFLKLQELASKFYINIDQLADWIAGDKYVRKVSKFEEIYINYYIMMLGILENIEKTFKEIEIIEKL